MSLTEEYLILLGYFPDPDEALRIFQGIHYPYLNITKGNIKPDDMDCKPKTKRQEIEESLAYLQSKTKKTNQDKMSIDALKKVLMNM